MTAPQTIGAALAALPTLSVGQADSLKIDTATVRVWLARVGPADGADPAEAVTVEARVFPQPAGSPEWQVVATTRADARLRELAPALDGPSAQLAGDLARIIRRELHA